MFKLKNACVVVIATTLLIGCTDTTILNTKSAVREAVQKEIETKKAKAGEEASGTETGESSGDSKIEYTVGGQTKTVYRSLNSTNDLAAIQKYNYILADIYENQAQSFDFGNRATNVFLLTLAIGTVIENPNFDSSSITKGILGIRGLEEVFTYVNPAQAGEALYIAAQEARCFNSVSIEENLSDKLKKAQLLKMMRESDENLRIRLKRETVSFFDVAARIVGGTKPASNAVVTIRNDSFRRIAVAEDKAESTASGNVVYRTRLANCFREVKAPEN